MLLLRSCRRAARRGARTHSCSMRTPSRAGPHGRGAQDAPKCWRRTIRTADRGTASGCSPGLLAAGADSLAIAIEERMLARSAPMATARRFAPRCWTSRTSASTRSATRKPRQPTPNSCSATPRDRARFDARYQAGLCYMRLDRAGDALDQWEALVSDSASVPVAERAWARTATCTSRRIGTTTPGAAYQGLLDISRRRTPRPWLACVWRNATTTATATPRHSRGTPTSRSRFPERLIGREASRGVERTRSTA